MRSDPKSTTTPAFSAAFLLQFLNAEAEFEALRLVSTALGDRVAAGSATLAEPPTPELHSRSLTLFVASELAALAHHLDHQAAPAHIFALAEEHRGAAYRLARIAELVPQLHSLALLFAELEDLSPPQVESWEPATEADGFAPVQYHPDPLRQLLSAARATAKRLRRMAGYLNTRLAVLPADTPNHLTLTAQTNSALAALADATVALEGVGG